MVLVMLNHTRLISEVLEALNRPKEPSDATKSASQFVMSSI